MNCSRDLLAAYLDQELDAAHKAEIEDHLDSCRDCSASYAQLLERQAAIRSTAPYYTAPDALREAVSASLQQAAGAGTQPSDSGSWRWLAIAACFFLAVSLAWNLTHLHPAVTREEILADNLLSSHIRSLIGTHLLDVVSTDQHTVKPWFNGKLDFSPNVRDFAPQGFPLIGGRIEYLSGHPAAALVYQRRKHLINVFTWPASSADAKSSEFSRNGYHELEWTAGTMTYWAVSDLGQSELLQFRDLWK
jgi:anti-sigma factor RsiW